MSAAAQSKLADSVTAKKEVRRKAAVRRSRRRWLKRALVALSAITVIGLIVVAVIPSPASVDTARVERGPLVVRLLESGKTRLRHTVVLRAPIAGNLDRLEVWPGDPVTESQVLGRLSAVTPPLLSAKERRLAQARLTAARASLKAARSEASRASLAVEKLAADRARIESLVARGAAAKTRADEVRHAYQDALHAQASSRFRVSVALGEQRAAEAVLGDGPRSESAAIEVRAPISGTVLRVLRRDAGPVATGEPLVKLGVLESLEIVIDVLTADAVRLRPGARIDVRGWGGGRSARARLSRIEPAGFTRLSALGVQEQRVNVIARFDGSPPPRLGDAYGVDVEIVVAESEDTVVAPLGALFQRGEDWAVYRVIDGRARLARVDVGLRGDFQVEITAGLKAGDELILHPGDRINDGTRVERRAASRRTPRTAPESQ